MYHQIPAITFIDESLPLEPAEEKENIELLSDEAFNSVLSDIVLIINNFDEEEFRETKPASFVSAGHLLSVRDLTLWAAT
ncbi:MAG: hypothetical protein IJ416_03695 [Ruminiclostridium sp.]|nr:hypothetical protein [Ruminiclostridium sp.]